jgi:predicted Zn-dependent protease
LAGSGNWKLKYVPLFEIADSEDVDIRIRWDANLQKDQGVSQEVVSETTGHVVNGRFVYVDINLELEIIS